MPKDYDKVKKSLLSEYATENLLPLDSYNKTSKEKVLWFCKHCSENYPAQIRKRVYEASGCPRCARKRSSIPLSKEFPNLLKDYDTKKMQNTWIITQGGAWKRFGGSVMYALMKKRHLLNREHLEGADAKYVGHVKRCSEEIK